MYHIGRINSYLKTLRERVGLGHSQVWNALKAKSAIADIEAGLDPGELDGLRAKAMENYEVDRAAKVLSRGKPVPTQAIAPAAVASTPTDALAITARAQQSELVKLNVQMAEVTKQLAALPKAEAAPTTFVQHVRHEMKAQGISKATAVGYCVKQFPTEYAIYRAAQATRCAEIL